MNEKHMQFVNEFLTCFNASTAYEAVYAPKNREVAASNGYRLLRNADISKAIRLRLQESAMLADEVLMRLAEQARGDIGTFLDTDGNIALAGKPTRLIKKIRQKLTTRSWVEDEKTITAVTTETELELYDAQAALQLIGRYHKLFTDKTELTASLEFKDAEEVSERLVSRLADLGRKIALFDQAVQQN